MGTITCNCSAIGALGKLLVEKTGSAPRTFNASSDRIEFIYEKLGTSRVLQYSGAITGSLSRLKTGVKKHSYITQGVIALQPSPAQLGYWLPLITGGTTGAGGSGTRTDYDADGNDVNITLSNILPGWDSMVYRENGIFQYTDLQVAQAILRGRTSNGGEANEFMELILVVIGQQEIITQTGDPSPWPSPEPVLPVTADYLPYAFWEGDFFINGTQLQYEEFTLMIDNKLSVKFFDEIYPTCIRSTGRDIKMDVKLPFTCDGLEQSLALNEAEGTAELVLKTPDTTPTFHTSFYLPYARSTFKTPVIEGKSDIPLEISVEAYAATGNDELVITHDQTV